MKYEEFIESYKKENLEISIDKKKVNNFLAQDKDNKGYNYQRIFFNILGNILVFILPIYFLLTIRSWDIVIYLFGSIWWGVEVKRAAQKTNTERIVEKALEEKSFYNAALQNDLIKIVSKKT